MRSFVPGVVATLLLVTSCSTPASPATTTHPPAEPTKPPTTTATPTTTAERSTTTTTVLETSYPYAVIAEESRRSLAVIDLECDDSECGFALVQRHDLAHRPHNLASIGSLVFATHPGAGAITRLDLETGDLLTRDVGIEPHDVKYSDSGVLYVADEDGRRVLVLAPDDLLEITSYEMPAKPHDLAVDGGTVWVTLNGSDEMARVVNGQVEMVHVGGSPHDLIVGPSGEIWFSNWGSPTLNVYNPITMETRVAPAGVVEPHHFALGPDGSVWVSDNGGSSVVGFGSQTISVEVGPVPHHLAFADDLLIVAGSSRGEAVIIRGDAVVGRVELSPGLHGVAVVFLKAPPG